MAKTGFVYHELYLWHDTGNYAGFLPFGFPLQPGIHIEHPETKRRFKNLLDASGYIKQLSIVEPRHATREELLRFHTADYVDRVKEMSDGHGGDAGELTPVGHGSFEIATLSTGGVIEGTDAVIAGDLDNCYALVRPPGHHADADQGRGFCVFGNIAIAVHHCLAVHKMERIAVVDWDVHHGNGTETAFYDDPRVLTVSLHQDNWYPPGRGLVADTGEGAGEGFAMNVPLPPGSGVGAYTAAFDQIVVPALRRFEPEIIFVASGFDASAFDPLGRMMMTSAGYALLTGTLVAAAAELCGGKIVMSHEGGYSPEYVPLCGLAVLEAMTGISSGIEDPYLAFAGGMGKQELQPAQQELIDTVRAIHGL
jgi:acetoin utilization deacetylase AcuC-like enzyme